jgi:3'-5' exoribonuclease
MVFLKESKMTTRVNVRDLAPKEECNSSFYVKFIAVQEAKDGKKYINIVLADGTGDIEARIWTNAEEVSRTITKGDYVAVQGKVNLYQGRKQFVIGQIDKLSPADVNKDDYVMKSPYEPGAMYKELVEIVEHLEDVYIRELLQNVLGDKEITRRLKTWQAGKTIHHAYQSGLLEHVLSCTRLAVDLSKFYQVNTSYVVAGAILHDLCKIYELSDGVNVEYTEEGKLVGHLVKSLEIIDRFSYRIEGFPYQMKLHLKHIMLSHHGEYAYGSPKIPQTREAMLVHLIDLMDSKMHTFETIRSNDPNVGHWSNFVKHLDRIVYKDELPTYATKEQAPSSGRGERKKKPAQKEIKQSLGGLLKDIKIED